MPRPRNPRQVRCMPCTDYFKPRGIPLRALEEVTLAVEELEALRLADLEGMEQMAGAEQMEVSRPTFARVLASARKKVADALVNGKALRIEGGVFRMAENVPFCGRRGHVWGRGRGGGCGRRFRGGREFGRGETPPEPMPDSE